MEGASQVGADDGEEDELEVDGASGGGMGGYIRYVYADDVVDVAPSGQIVGVHPTPILGKSSRNLCTLILLHKKPD